MVGFVKLWQILCQSDRWDDREKKTENIINFCFERGLEAQSSANITRHSIKKKVKNERKVKKVFNDQKTSSEI